MRNLFALCLVALMASPLFGQTPPSGDAPGGDLNLAAPQTASPAPPRNIMPATLNHKPNATNPPAELAKPIDLFFAGLKAGDYQKAYDTFLAGSRLGLQEQKKSAFISKTQEAFGIYGKLHDYEVFDNYSVGSNVIVLTYLSRHDEQPLRWRFIFYRPDTKWQLINMGFDDVLLEMLD